MPPFTAAGQPHILSNFYPFSNIYALMINHTSTSNCQAQSRGTLTPEAPIRPHYANLPRPQHNAHTIALAQRLATAPRPSPYRTIPSFSYLNSEDQQGNWPRPPEQVCVDLADVCPPPPEPVVESPELFPVVLDSNEEALWAQLDDDPLFSSPVQPSYALPQTPGDSGYESGCATPRLQSPCLRPSTSPRMKSPCLRPSTSGKQAPTGFKVPFPPGTVPTTQIEHFVPPILPVLLGARKAPSVSGTPQVNSYTERLLAIATPPRASAIPTTSPSPSSQPSAKALGKRRAFEASAAPPQKRQRLSESPQPSPKALGKRRAVDEPSSPKKRQSLSVSPRPSAKALGKRRAVDELSTSPKKRQRRSESPLESLDGSDYEDSDPDDDWRPSPEPIPAKRSGKGRSSRATKQDPSQKSEKTKVAAEEKVMVCLIEPLKGQPECPYASKYPKDRNRHMDIHFPNRFVCPNPECAAEHGRLDALKRHCIGGFKAVYETTKEEEAALTALIERSRLLKEAGLPDPNESKLPPRCRPFFTTPEEDAYAIHPAHWRTCDSYRVRMPEYAADPLRVEIPGFKRDHPHPCPPCALRQEKERDSG